MNLHNNNNNKNNTNRKIINKVRKECKIIQNISKIAIKYTLNRKKKFT